MPTAVAKLGFSLPFVLYICHIICTKTDATRITKLDIEMFRDEWVLETHLFWDQKARVTSHKNISGVGRCTLVSAVFF